MTTRHTVAIVSGGMDSVTLAYHLAARGDALHLLSFDYGQRHGSRELDCAAQCARDLGAVWDRIDLSGIRDLISASSLTSDQAVPDGHYAEQTMKATVVPNRNMMMLSIAAAIAVSEKADAVATGVHGGDHFIYPDCRPEFVAAASAAVLIGNTGGFAAAGFRGIEAPFVHHDKAWIAGEGDRLGVPWHHTWSCYKGGDVHCGRCGTCVERREAFHLAGVNDPTEYADRDFWREACGL
jgi:7-cyano-7-deazaguanine synthase